MYRRSSYISLLFLLFLSSGETSFTYRKRGNRLELSISILDLSEPKMGTERDPLQEPELDLDPMRHNIADK